MKEERFYKEIEQELGIGFSPELKKYYGSNVFKSKEEEKIMMNCNHLINDWKYNYNFEILKTKGKIIKLSNVISDSIKSKVLCFAWSYETVEKDTGLFYMEDNKIYGYSGNFSNDYKPDLITSDFISILNPNSKDRFLKLEEIIQPKNLFYGDQESVDQVTDYEEMIKKYFINTSDNRLILKMFRGEEIGLEKRKIQLELNNKEFKFELKTHSGWIDPEIIRLMNDAIKELGIKDKFFIEIHDYNFGQELGVAFVNEEEKLKLIGANYSKE